jgi:serine/threonine-protein phosphatase 5
MGNKGAYVRFTGKDMEPKIETFEKVDHPKIPPMAYVSKFGGLF